MILKKVISGGQDGADFGGLLGAAFCGIPTGGTAPPGFVTASRKDPAILRSYGLVEGMPDPAIYPKRTMKNVDDSDGTVALLWKPSVGTSKTIGYCQTHKWQNPVPDMMWPGLWYKPCLRLLQVPVSEAADRLFGFITTQSIGVLNVAGNHDADGIDKYTRDLIILTYKRLME